MRITKLCTALVMVMACGGSGSERADGQGGTGGAGGARTDGGGSDVMLDPAFQPFCRGVKDAYVGLGARCTGVALEIAAQLVHTDPCAAWGPAVAAGSMRFDPTDAAACLTALQALACDADTTPNVCDHVLSGQLTPGQPCNLARKFSLISECEVGTFCVAGLSGGCQGVCAAGGLLTKPCDFDQPCVSGETCNLGTGTCDLKGSAGEACGLDSIVACEGGLYCSDLFGGGTCSTRKAAGGTCSTPFECAFGTACDRGLAIEGTCRVPPKPGDACTPQEYQCSVGLSYCGADSKCHALAGLGQPCVSTDGEGTSCLVGQCDTTLATPVCKLAAVGAYCVTDGDCGSNAICAGQMCTAACF